MNNKISVCFLIHSLEPGGAERTVSYLANYGSESGFEVHVVLYGKRGFYHLNDKVKLSYLDDGSHIKRWNIFKRTKRIIKRKRAFKKYVYENGINVVVCLLYPSLFYCFGLKKEIRVIGSERANPSFLKNPIKVFLRTLFFEKCSGVVFQTQKARDYYIKARIKSFAIIQNAAGNEFAYNFVPNKKERRKAFTAVGTLKEEKGYPVLINAFYKISQIYDDFSLEIYGSGPLELELKNMCKELGIDKKVLFFPGRSDALECISNSFCYVLSSVSEGMPNSLIEAMSVGLPCISTDCPNGPSEIIDDGINGLLVPVNDCDALCEAMKKLITDYEFAKTIGNNALKIKETNSISVIGKKYYDFFINKEN